MAHTLFTPEQAAASVLAALRYLTNLPRTVRMDFSDEFVAGRGQTVNVRGPVSAGDAKVYTKTKRDNRDDIEFNELTQTWTPVKLDDQVYNAVRLPDNWATFTLESLEKEVLLPQAESVVDALPVPLLGEMKKIKAPPATGTGADVAYNAPTALRFKADGSNALDVIARLRRTLNSRKVPTQTRTLAVGPAVAEILLGLENLTRVSEAGTAETLREATLGRLYGFTIVEDFALPEDFAIGYHRDAFAFVTRASRVPEGAAKGTTISQDGFTLRHIMHYNPIKLEDQSIVDTFFGAATLDAKRAAAAGIATD